MSAFVPSLPIFVRSAVKLTLLAFAVASFALAPVASAQRAPDTLGKIKAAKGAFALCAVQPPVLEVLDISGFMNLIQVHPERYGALSALA